jgi:hypothetical protein
MCGNRVLRRILGPKRDELRGDGRKMHNENLHNLHSSLCRIGIEDELGRKSSIHWQEINSSRILVEKPEGKKPVGIFRLVSKII